MKDILIHTRVDDRDRERLRVLAEALEIPESAVIRRLIKEAFEKLSPEQQKPKTSK